MYSLFFHNLLIKIHLYDHALFTEVVWNTRGDLGVSLLHTKEMGHPLKLNLLDFLLTHWHQRYLKGVLSINGIVNSFFLRQLINTRLKKH